MVKYTIIDKIGKGKFGCIYQVINNKTKKKYIMKYIHGNPKSELNILQILQQNPSNFYITMIEHHFSSKNNLMIITHDFRAIDLNQFIKTQHIKHTETYNKIILQLLQGLQAIHSLQIVHMDVKPKNILINNNNEIQYIDFGLSCTPDQTDYKRYRGTVHYMDALIIKRNVKTFEQAKLTDIWALGLTIYKLTHNRLPWKSKTKKDLRREIVKKPRIRSRIPNFSDVIDSMLIREQSQRSELNDLIMIYEHKNENI